MKRLIVTAFAVVAVLAVAGICGERAGAQGRDRWPQSLRVGVEETRLQWQRWIETDIKFLKDLGVPPDAADNLVRLRLRQYEQIYTAGFQDASFCAALAELGQDDAACARYIRQVKTEATRRINR